MGVGSDSVTGMTLETEYRGMKEFFAFLDFMNDKDMLKREVLRLEKKRSEANAAVLRVGKLTEIDGLHAKAADALEKGREKKALAEAEATKVLCEARDEAVRVRAEARGYSQRSREKADKQESELRDRGAALDKRAAEIIKTETIARRKAEKAESVLAEASALKMDANVFKMDYEERVGRLEKAMK